MRRAIAAVVFLVLGVVAAVVAPIVGGDRFLPNWGVDWQWIRFTTTTGGSSPTTWVHIGALGKASVAGAVPMPPADFLGLVASDPAWIAATVALVVIPLWFLWWRRSEMTFARGIGVLASAAATAALVALVWPASALCAAHVLVAAPVAYLAAFLVAPPLAHDVTTAGR